MCRNSGVIIAIYVYYISGGIGGGGFGGGGWGGGCNGSWEAAAVEVVVVEAAAAVTSLTSYSGNPALFPGAEHRADGLAPF